MLVSAVPFLIAAAPLELGPEVFAGTMGWRLLTNGAVIYVALGELGEKHYLSFETGMTEYDVGLGLAAVGLVMFFRNFDEDFDRSLFWRPKRGKQHGRDCWTDENIWAKGITKDDEIWGWVEYTRPTYFPTDIMT